MPRPEDDTFTRRRRYKTWFLGLAPGTRTRRRAGRSSATPLRKLCETGRLHLRLREERVPGGPALGMTPQRFSRPSGVRAWAERCLFATDTFLFYLCRRLRTVRPIRRTQLARGPRWRRFWRAAEWCC